MTSPQPRRSRFGRATRFVLAFTVAVVGLVGVNAAPAAALSPPPTDGCVDYSSLGGVITQAEIWCRVSYWYGHRYDSDMTYDSSKTHWDYAMTRQYRRDCSGLVDMAWHLNADPNSSGLTSSTYSKPLLNSSGAFDWSQLQPGDILTDPNVHTILFVKWDNAEKTQFDYYAFGGTPMKYATTTTSASTIDSHSRTAYKPYRYRNLAS